MIYKTRPVYISEFIEFNMSTRASFKKNVTFEILLKPEHFEHLNPNPEMFNSAIQLDNNFITNSSMVMNNGLESCLTTTTGQIRIDIELSKIGYTGGSTNWKADIYKPLFDDWFEENKDDYYIMMSVEVKELEETYFNITTELENCTTNLEVFEYPDDVESEIEIEILADEYGSFKEPIIINDRSYPLDNKSYYNEDNTTFFMNYLVDSDIHIIAKAIIEVPEPTYHNITTDLENCTINLDVFQYDDSVENKIDIIITGIDGSYFADHVYIGGVKYKVMTPWGDVSPQFNKDKTVFTINRYLLESNIEIIAHATEPEPEPEPDPEYHTITLNLENCTSNIDELIYDTSLNTELDIKIYANEGYEFTKNITIGLQTYPLTVRDDNIYFNDDYTIFSTLTPYKLVSDIEINVVATEKIVIPEPDKFTITTDLENCTIELDEFVHDKNTLIEYYLKANEGYEFDYVQINDFKYYSGSTVMNPTNTQMRVKHLLMKDTHVIARTILIDDINPEPDLPDKLFMFTNIYQVDDTMLIELSKLLYMTSIAGIGGNTIDITDYIHDLYNASFDFTPITSDKSESIILGNLSTTNIRAYPLYNYKLNVNLGVIDVKQKYNNAYDYINTECILNVPYIEPISLEPEKIVGSKISLEFILNLYGRNFTLNVYSDFNKSILYTTTAKFGEQIPFMNKFKGSISNIDDVQLNNDIRIPFIEVIRNVPINIDNITGNNTFESGILGSYNGYVEVGQIILNTTSTNTEKDEMILLLKNGVVIK